MLYHELSINWQQKHLVCCWFGFLFRYFYDPAVSSRAVLFTMAVDDVARRAYLAEHVSSNLQYIWQECDVSLGTHHTLAQHYNTMKVFSSMCDTKAEVREALRTDFRIDPATSPETRADVDGMEAVTINDSKRTRTSS